MPPGARTLLLVIVLTTSVSVKPDDDSARGLTLTWIDGVTVPFSDDVRNAGNLLERRHDLVDRQRREIADAQRARAQHQRDHDGFAGIVERDLRRGEVVGQRVLRVLHSALDLHQIVVLIRGQLENGDDRRRAGLNRGLQIIEVRATRELIFERTHDRVAHLGRRRARIAEQHLDRRDVGARETAAARASTRPPTRPG